VTCITAGEFEITFADEDHDENAMSYAVVCQSPPDSSSTIARTPDSVEIVPALGNVSHSLITVTLLEDGEQAAPGYEVDFTVDRCTIEVAGVDTAAEYGAARTVFGNLNRNYYPSAADIEASAAAIAAIDSSRQQDNVKGFFNTAGDATVAAAPRTEPSRKKLSDGSPSAVRCWRARCEVAGHNEGLVTTRHLSRTRSTRARSPVGPTFEGCRQCSDARYRIEKLTTASEKRASTEQQQCQRWGLSSVRASRIRLDDQPGSDARWTRRGRTRKRFWVFSRSSG
jgi:hypothetical protein